MELEEIKGRLDRIRSTLLRGGAFDVDWAVEALSAAREHLDDAEDDGPPVDVDDGFVILPMPRYEALREAEETLQETRFAPAVSEQQDRIDALSRLIDQLKVAIEGRDLKIDELRTDIDMRNRRISSDAEDLASLRAGAAAPLRTAEGDEEMSRRVDHLMRRVDDLGNMDGVLVRHIQDLQGEINGIKDRLDEGCGQFNKIKDRLDTAHEQSAALFCSHWDRINALAARMDRMNGLESEFVERVDVLAGRMDATDKAVGETLGTIFDRLGALTGRMNQLKAREGFAHNFPSSPIGEVAKVP